MPSDTAKPSAKPTLSDKDIATYPRRGGPSGGSAGTDADTHTDVDAHAEADAHTDAHAKPSTDVDTDTAKTGAEKTDRKAGG